MYTTARACRVFVTVTIVVWMVGERSWDGRMSQNSRPDSSRVDDEREGDLLGDFSGDGDLRDGDVFGDRLVLSGDGGSVGTPSRNRTVCWGRRSIVEGIAPDKDSDEMK